MLTIRAQIKFYFVLFWSEIRGKSVRSLCDGSSDRSFMVYPLSYFSFQPVLHHWYNKGYVLSCLWDCAYKRTLAANLNGPLPYVRRHITVTKCVVKWNTSFLFCSVLFCSVLFCSVSWIFQWYDSRVKETFGFPLRINTWTTGEFRFAFQLQPNKRIKISIFSFHNFFFTHGRFIFHLSLSYF